MSSQEKFRVFKEVSSKYYNIDPENINYSELCDDVLKLSGATYALINFLTEDRRSVRSVAVSGIKKNILKASEFFGFDLIGREWPLSDFTMEVLNARSLIRKTKIEDTTTLVNSQLAGLLKDMFNIGDMYSVGIFSPKEVIGTLVLILTKNQVIEEYEHIELFARQLGGLIYRAESDKKLQEEQKRTKIITENSPDLLTIIDADYRITYVNKTHEGFNQTRQVIGDDVLRHVPADAKELYTKWLRQLFRTGVPINEEFKTRDSNSNTCNYAIQIVPIKNNATITNAYLILSNITERKKNELEIIEIKNRINDIVESTDDLLWHVNYITGDHYYGKNAFKMFGYTPEEFMNDKDLWWKIIHPDDQEFVRKKYSSLSESNNKIEVEYRAIKKNNTQLIVLARIKVEKGNDNKLFGTFGIFSDINNLRNAEKGLNRAQSIAKIGSWELDIKTGNLFWSKQMYKLFELSQVSGDNIIEASRTKIIKEDLALMDETINDAVSRKKEFQFEYRIRCNDGSVKYILNTGECVINEKEEVVKLTGTAQDITERKEIERKLELKNKQIKEFTDTVNQGAMVVHLNTKGTILFANDLFYGISGHSSKEIVGKNYSIISSGDHDIVFWKNFWKTLGSGKIWKGEIKSIRKDGANFWVYTVVNPIFDEKGTIEQYLSIGYEVTERKNTEFELNAVKKQMDDIINNVDSAVWSTDTKGNFLFINQASERLSGYSTQEFINDKGVWKKMYSPGTLQKIRGYNVELFRHGSVEREYEIITKHGEKKWVSAKSKLVKDACGKPIRIDSVSTDITKRIRDEKELKNAKQKLDSIFEEMEDVVWSISLPDIKLIFITPSINTLFGISPEEFADNKELWERIVFGEDKSVLGRIREQLLSDKGSYEEEYKIIDTRGRAKWIRNKAKLIRDEDDRIVRIDGYISDISDNKLYEHTLKESEANLKEAENIAKIGRWELDLIRNKLLWSDNVYKIWEIPEKTEVVTYDDLLDNLHPEDRNRVHEAYIQSLKSKTRYHIEHRLITPGGQTKWVTSNCITHYDNDDRPVRSVGIVQDITHRKVSELELIRLKRNLEQTNEVAMLGGWEYNVETGTTIWSSITRIIYGVDEDYVPDIQFARFYKEGQSRESITQAMENIFSSGESFNLEAELAGATKHHKWVEAIGKSEVREGKVKRIYGTFRDITAKKNAELIIEQQNKFQKLIAEISTNLVKATVANVEEVVNNSLKLFGEFMGVERCFVFQIKDRLISNTHDWHAPHLASSKHRVQNVPVSQFPWFEEQINKQQVFIVPDVQNAPLELAAEKVEMLQQGLVSVMFIRLENSDVPFGIFGVGTNTFLSDFSEDTVSKIKVVANVISDVITKSKFEMEYIHAKEHAEFANVAKTEFLANISHEIRTPMNAILGFADLLKGKTMSTKHEGYLEGILAGGRSLMSLINDILDLSKIEAGKMEIHYSMVNIEPLMKELYSIFKQKAKEKKLRFSYFIEPEIPKYLLIDEVRLRQILFNLIGNAIKFTHTGNVSVHIGSNWEENESKRKLIIRVIDTGIGIPEDQQEVIFEPFRQMDGQSTRKYEGTGLGLAITKRLVNIMKGIITIQSTINVGTTVSVILEDVNAVVPEVRNVQASEQTQNVDFRGQTILLVEDVESNRQIVKGFLESNNLNIIEAENGKVALDMLQTFEPHLILMDMMMPVMDGYEATQKIKSQSHLKHIPIIALTASALTHNESNIREFCDDYIRKPFSKEKLIVILKYYLVYQTQGHHVNSIEKTKTIKKQSAAKKTPELHIGSEEKVLFDKKWKEVSELMSIDDIQEFANELLAYAKAKKKKSLEKYAEKLNEYAQGFDIENLIALFNEFSKE